MPNFAYLSFWNASWQRIRCTDANWWWLVTAARCNVTSFGVIRLYVDSICSICMCNELAICACWYSTPTGPGGTWAGKRPWVSPDPLACWTENRVVLITQYELDSAKIYPPASIVVGTGNKPVFNSSSQVHLQIRLRKSFAWS